MSFRLNFRLNGSTLYQSDTGNQPSYSEQLGAGNAASGNFSLTSGSGNGSANIIYRGNGSGLLNVPAGGSTTINLKGANGEKDSINNTLNLASVKVVFYELVTPGNGNLIGIGPNGNATKANMGFNANGYHETDTEFLATSLGTGWTISSGAANVTFTNPGGANQVIRPRIIGVGG